MLPPLNRSFGSTENNEVDLKDDPNYSNECLEAMLESYERAKRGDIRCIEESNEDPEEELSNGIICFKHLRELIEQSKRGESHFFNVNKYIRKPPPD